MLEVFCFPVLQRKREVLGRNVFMGKDGWQLFFSLGASAAYSKRKTGVLITRAFFRIHNLLPSRLQHALHYSVKFHLNDITTYLTNQG